MVESKFHPPESIDDRRAVDLHILDLSTSEYADLAATSENAGSSSHNVRMPKAVWNQIVSNTVSHHLRNRH